MIKNREIFSALDETVHKFTLSTGLEIYLLSKPTFKSNYAVFGTRYGSVDNRFARDGGPFTDVPAGIAHFLEHKLFESEDGDAFSRFSATGASANAYTSFDRTCYLFNCSARFDENLDILLDFVRHPYFTPETVQKEQGIIGQEIRMYEDSPDWVLYISLLKCLYKEHPVRIDITGTADSIAEITDKLLYSCYDTFYNPNNMFICAAGNFDIEATINKIDSALKNDVGHSITKGDFTESPSVYKKRSEKRMTVAMPMFAVGIKCDPKLTLADMVAANVVAEAVSSTSSPLFTELTEKNLIGDSLGYENFFGNGFYSMIFDGDSFDPNASVKLITDYIKKMQKDGMNADEFEGTRRRIYGNAVKHFDSADDIVGQLVDCAVHGFEPYRDIKLLQSITTDDVNAFLRRIDTDNIAVSTVLPKE